MAIHPISRTIEEQPYRRYSHTEAGRLESTPFLNFSMLLKGIAVSSLCPIPKNDNENNRRKNYIMGRSSKNPSEPTEESFSSIIGWNVFRFYSWPLLTVNLIKQLTNNTIAYCLGATSMNHVTTPRYAKLKRVGQLIAFPITCPCFLLSKGGDYICSGISQSASKTINLAKRSFSKQNMKSLLTKVTTQLAPKATNTSENTSETSPQQNRKPFLSKVILTAGIITAGTLAGGWIGLLGAAKLLGLKTAVMGTFGLVATKLGFTAGGATLGATASATAATKASSYANQNVATRIKQSFSIFGSRPKPQSETPTTETASNRPTSPT